MFLAAFSWIFVLFLLIASHGKVGYKSIVILLHKKLGREVPLPCPPQQTRGPPPPPPPHPALWSALPHIWAVGERETDRP